MIAMSTVITVMTAATMHLKIKSNDEIFVQELCDQIESDPNYPIIPSTLTNQLVDSEHKKDTCKELHQSKLMQLIDHLLPMNICVSDNYHLSYQTTFSKPNKNRFRNITQFKSIVYFNYLIAANYTS